MQNIKLWIKQIEKDLITFYYEANLVFWYISKMHYQNQQRLFNPSLTVLQYKMFFKVVMRYFSDFPALLNLIYNISGLIIIICNILLMYLNTYGHDQVFATRNEIFKRMFFVVIYCKKNYFYCFQRFTRRKPTIGWIFCILHKCPKWSNVDFLKINIYITHTLNQLPLCYFFNVNLKIIIVFNQL